VPNGLRRVCYGIPTGRFLAKVSFALAGLIRVIPHPSIGVAVTIHSAFSIDWGDSPPRDMMKEFKDT
jgi:hypothetical protein